MIILLMEPPWYVFMKGILRQPNAPLGACYLAGVLEKAGYEVAVLNPDLLSTGGVNQYSEEMKIYQDFLREEADPSHPIWREIKRVLDDFRPDILGLTIRTPSLPSALNVAALAKGLEPGIKVMLGGPHPTLMPDETAHFPHVDAIVRGEGEQTVLDLVRAWEEGRSLDGIPGVSYWNETMGKVVHGPPRKLIENIDSIPFPAKHLILNRENLMEQDDYCTLLNSRGCPYECIFCSSPSVWTRRVRYRSAENMVEEMVSTYQRFDTRYFSFQDDTFTLNHKVVLRLCDEIIARGLNGVPGFRWTCNTRPEMINGQLVRRMKEAGCAAVAIGIESGNDEILRKMQKGYTTAQVREAAYILRENEIVFTGQFLIGMPFETEKEIWDTVRFAEELKPVSVMLSVATPLPGTKLYQMAQEMGYFPDGLDWRRVTTKNDGILFHPQYSRGEVSRILHEVQAAFDTIQGRTLEVKNESRLRYERMYKKNAIPAYGFQQMAG